jgi:agmatinase
MSNPMGNFLDLPADFIRYPQARYAVLPVPYEGTVSYMAGTAGAPQAILDASTHVELFDEELGGEFYQAGVTTLPVVLPAPGPEDQLRRVREAAGKPVADGKFLLTLGGEHSITTPLVELCMQRYGELSVLQIDAHADLRDSYRGSSFSHGAVMRRVLDLTGSLCQVGIRSYSKEEFEQCPEQVRQFVTPQVIASDPQWIDRVIERLRPNVYVTIDIDGFDPAYAPGTGTPEPGGLDWMQVTGLLRKVCAKRQVVSADIVEVRPIPPSHITEYLAARLAYKMIAYTQRA